jgi:hypothetical protein
MNRQEAIEAVRQLLKARDEKELSQLIGLYLPAVDGTFFTVLRQSVEQLKRENKPEIAHALETLGTQILKMKTLI